MISAFAMYTVYLSPVKGNGVGTSSTARNKDLTCIRQNWTYALNVLIRHKEFLPRGTLQPKRLLKLPRCLKNTLLRRNSACDFGEPAIQCAQFIHNLLSDSVVHFFNLSVFVDKGTVTYGGSLVESPFGCAHA